MSEAHIRSDEGIKRGPRGKPAAWPERKPPIAGKLGRDFNPDTVIERYLQGEELAEIAATLGVHPKALNYHLLKDEVREKWRAAQVAVSLGEYHEAKQVVRDSPDALSLGRAREALKSSQWDLERLESRLFSQKQEVAVTMDIHVQVDHALTAEAGELLGRIRGPVASNPKVIDVAALPPAGAITPPKAPHS